MKKIWAFIVAFFVFMIIGLSMRAMGPYIAGAVIMLFEIGPATDPNDVKILEATGNIFNLIFSWYLSRKVYKNIAGTKE
jgi:hypothetical protein